jgi:UDP-glucose 4-epimerase
MNYLITGASGFIGRNLLDFLQTRSSYIYAIGKKISTSSAYYIAEDYTNFPEYEKYIFESDIVIHLAHTTNAASIDPVHDINFNLLNTINLLRKCKKGSHFIYISTGGAMYGECSKPAVEEDNPNPISYYAVGKLAIEKYIELISRANEFNYTILRVTNSYGPFQDLSKGVGAVNTFIEKIYKNMPITIWGDGSNTRDYIFIDDVVKAISETAEKRIYGTYNISYGESYSLNEVIGVISSLSKITPVIHYQSRRPFDLISVKVSNRKFAEATGWLPKVSVEEGIQKLLALVCYSGS